MTRDRNVDVGGTEAHRVEIESVFVHHRREVSVELAQERVTFLVDSVVQTHGRRRGHILMFYSYDYGFAN